MKRRQLGSQRFTSEKKQLIKTWFDMLDADGNGELSVQELSDALLSSGCARTKHNVRDLISRLDSNGDGVVDFSEFLRVFERADAMGDGKVAALLMQAVRHLKQTIASVDNHRQLPASLAMSIAKRRSVLEMMENVYRGPDYQAQIAHVRSERKQAVVTQDKQAMRRASFQLRTLEQDSLESTRRRRTLALLVPNIKNSTPADWTSDRRLET